MKLKNMFKNFKNTGNGEETKMRGNLRTMILPLVLLTLILAMAGLASAIQGTLTLNMTATSNNLIGNVSMNVTVTGTGTDATASKIVNVTYYAYSRTTANGSDNTDETVIYQIEITGSSCTVNSTVGDGDNGCKAAADTLNLEDHTTYYFYAIGKNNSEKAATLTSATLGPYTIDNAQPDEPWNYNPKGNYTSKSGKVRFDATVVGANTTTCKLYLGAKGGKFAEYTGVTHDNTPNAAGANNCTKTLIIPRGKWDWYMIADDGLNFSNKGVGITAYGRVIYDPSETSKAVAKAVNTQAAADAAKKTIQVTTMNKKKQLGLVLLFIIIVGLLAQKAKIKRK